MASSHTPWPHPIHHGLIPYTVYDTPWPQPIHSGTPLPLGHVAGWVHRANEDRLELAHARVGEQQRGVVQGDGGGGVHILVTLLGGQG